MNLAAICLALVLYHEARGEPIEGQLAVAETVFNRMEKGAYPDSVCGVATQAKQYATTTVDNLLPTEIEAWEKSLLISQLIVLDPEGTLPQTGATHFHTTDSRPWWAGKLHPLGEIGGHRFYADFN